ncbi:SH2 domain-containing adapter protein E [Oncorhynchus mykiss]|uniref:SH2 domain-containing adapter protein E n=1 Tax=Oncorhynchus mykiss TaxID=8022 RepID=UPI001878CE60|nr:SH2 domain-containing adapter protein E [Oncorhynchus mykiss]
MAKWFKEFPINLKNGTDRIRSASESGSQSRGKLGLVAGIGTKVTSSKVSSSKNSGTDSSVGGGAVGALPSGRNRKNSAELGRNGTRSIKDGKVWDSLIGKSRKNSKAETPVFDEHQPLKSSRSANAYISRLIKVDKKDKSPNFNSSPVVLDTEKSQPLCKTETVIIQDYADPFDAHKTREQRDAEREGENDGYMEPYDAQQMITEIRRRGSKDMLKMCVLLEGVEGEVEEGRPVPPQIYDMTYEGGVEGDGGSVKTPVTRPELDPRLPAEYQLPWEWKKEQIVKALPAQFNCPELPTPTKEDPPALTLTRQPQQQPLQQPQQQQQHLRQKSWSQKILKSSPTFLPSLSCPPSISPEAEVCRVDPTLPLEKQSWYHGCVTRQEAESQLQSCKEASFLVRNSESGTSKYSIALKTSQGCVHIIVAQTKENGYTLDQSSCVFPSIPEVVHHYSTQRLPFNGAEHMTLLYPVPRPY